MGLAIGEVARRTGCSVPTIRYYEQVGLISCVSRTENGRRVYGWPDVSRLTFIRRARDFGMPIEQVRELLAASDLPTNACAPAKSIVAERLAEVREKRAELAKLETSLQAMFARCVSECDEQTACCTIFEDISRSSLGYEQHPRA